MVALLFSLVLSHPLLAQVSIEAFSGTAWSLPTPLHIHQAGAPDIDLRAHYSTRPTEDTPYFGGRLVLWRNGAGWTFELIHHKLYLQDPPPEIQYFKITYGVNMVTLGRAWRRGAWGYSGALGAVVTHAANSIRGRKYTGTGGPLNKGYTFTGVTAHLGLQYRVRIVGGVSLVMESVLSASYMEVKVAGGGANVPNVALHLHAGVGYSF
jgi:hypothetical protein